MALLYYLLLALATPIVLFGALIMSMVIKAYWSYFKIKSTSGKPLPLSSFIQLMYKKFVLHKGPFETSLPEAKRCGSVYGVMNPISGGTTTIVLNDAEYAKRLFMDNANFPKFKISSRWLAELAGNENLVFSNGHEWKRQRAVVNPAFYRLDMLADVFNIKIKETMKKLDSILAENAADKKSLVMTADLMQRMTLDVLGLSVFGHDFNYLNDNSDEALQAYNFAWSNLLISFFHVILPFLNYVPTPTVNKMVSSVKTIDALIYRLIDKSKHREDKAVTNLLDMMVDANLNEEDDNKKMTDIELRNNCVAFFIAGHETTATSLSFALYCLAKYPHVQEKLFAEICEKLGANATLDSVTYDAVQNMPYLLAVIKESMRYYPPATQITYRNTQREEVFGDYILPVNSLVSVNVIAMHFDEKYWTKPFEYNPDRWLDQNDRQPRHPFAWAPFSAGTRVCIGNNFSILEQKLFLAQLLLKYRVELPEPNYEIPTEYKTVFTPSKEFKLNFKKRV